MAEVVASAGGSRVAAPLWTLCAAAAPVRARHVAVVLRGIRRILQALLVVWVLGNANSARNTRRGGARAITVEADGRAIGGGGRKARCRLQC